VLYVSDDRNDAAGCGRAKENERDIAEGALGVAVMQEEFLFESAVTH
jgi:hypothetical protein